MRDSTLRTRRTLGLWRLLQVAALCLVGVSVLGLSSELRRPAVDRQSIVTSGVLPADLASEPEGMCLEVDPLTLVSDTVWTVTLVDELFPAPPPAEPPPPAPPPLRLQLIAITGQGEARRVFVRDPVADLYLNLSPGDPVASGIVLATIDASGATFDVAGSSVRLELPR